MTCSDSITNSTKCSISDETRESHLRSLKSDYPMKESMKILIDKTIEALSNNDNVTICNNLLTSFLLHVDEINEQNKILSSKIEEISKVLQVRRMFIENTNSEQDCLLDDIQEILNGSKP